MSQKSSNFLDWLWITGIWLVPLWKILGGSLKGLGLSNSAGITVVVFVMVLNLLINLVTFSNGKRKYGPLDAVFFTSDPFFVGSRKHKYQYPPLPKYMASKSPMSAGLIIGRKGKLYCVNPMKSGGIHNIILGESGSGKSVTLIGTLLANPNIPVFAVDIKGELSQKSRIKGDPNTVIINPMDNESYGWDCFYRLKEFPEPQDIIDVCKDIAFSLIPEPNDSSAAFFINSARNLLNALLLYHSRKDLRAKKHPDIVEIIDIICSAPIQDQIEELWSEADMDSIERKLINAFIGMADETLTSISANLFEKTAFLIDDYNVRHMLSGNANKASPLHFTSSECKSVFLIIPEEKLGVYSRLCHLVINQILTECSRIDELDNKTTRMIIIDEYPALCNQGGGPIRQLEPKIATLRSKKVSITICSQSLAAMKAAHSDASVKAILNNCSYKIILSASDLETMQTVVKWAGTYPEVKYQHGRTGKNRSHSFGTEDKNIVVESELISLPQTGECIVISPFQYNRVKKVRYYDQRHEPKLYHLYENTIVSKN